MRPPRARSFGSFMFATVLCMVFVSLAVPAYGQIDYMTATFNDKPVDQAIGTGGPAVGEPTSVDAYVSATVRATPFATRCLDIVNLSLTGDVEFILDNPISEGMIATVSDLWFFEDLGCYYTLGLYSGQNMQVVQIFFEGGNLARISSGGNEIAQNLAYPSGRSLPILIAVDMTARTCSVWMDQTEVVADHPLPGGITSVQRVRLSAGYNCPEGGHMAVDQIRILDRMPPVAVEKTSWGKLRTLYR